jgi:patatin-like phospholipase/acyl hydrolase
VNGHNWFFVKDKATNKKKPRSVKLVDAAVASSCAPTCFNHWTINGIDGKNITFFDGGSDGTTTRQASKRLFTTLAAESNLVSLATGYYPGSTKTP